MTNGTPPEDPPEAPVTSGWRVIPSGIWTLGFVSMFMDMSSEMIHALLPVFLVTTLGASLVEVGLIEGMAEATASVTKVFSGALSDWLGRRKQLAVLGYGLAAFTKPLFALAPTVGWIFFARFADRVGKGIRGAPRDALVGDLAPAHLRGASYGLRQSLDTVGAFLGPLFAIALMAATANQFRTVFWIATVPAMLSVLLLTFLQEPRPRHESEPKRAVEMGETTVVDAQPARVKSRFQYWRSLPRGYWLLTAVATVLTFARFSEAFLVLRAQSMGLSVALVPLVLVTMNVIYAVSAWPVGHLSDRFSRPVMLAASLLPLIAADVVIAAAPGLWAVMVGVALWGLHMGMSQGLLAAMVADATPRHLRGTGFGVFYLLTGVALLVASVLAGWLWAAFGATATFAVGAVLGTTALACTPILIRVRPYVA